MSNNFTLRKNVNSLTAEELTAFRKAFSLLQRLPKADNRSFSHFAGMHGFPDQACWHEPRDIDGWPQVHLFLPWHRAYLYHLEKALQDQVPGVTIPYWDWRTEPGIPENIPPAFADANVADQPNPLYSFHIDYQESGFDFVTQRDPGQSDDAPHLPSSSEVDRVAHRFNHFEDFSERLRNIHNGVHLWVGGTMSSQDFAAFDPIFWAHHCMVDKLWWEWQKRFGIENVPDYYKTMALAPFENMTVQQTLDIYTLGYEYAQDSVQVVGAWR